MDVDTTADIHSVGFCGAMVAYDFDRVSRSKGDYVGTGNHSWATGFQLSFGIVDDAVASHR